jgi:nicotinate-nucleotide pyrophosphorylase (carboxylating)
VSDLDTGIPGFPAGDWTRELVRQSLFEDIGPGDATTLVTVDSDLLIEASVVARQPGTIAGMPLVAMLFNQLDSGVKVNTLVPDGKKVAPGDVVASLAGKACSILSGERTMLNFLQQLSGIATLTSRYVEKVQGTRCKVLDTRKTLPGYRHLAKYAVRCGGGFNHRMGLHDRIMLKDNHWAAAGGRIADLVARGRRDFPGMVIEVEVDNLAQLEQVLPLNVEWIMLDNFSFAETAEAVRIRDAAGSSALIESSGNVTLETIAGYAKAGSDAASVGRLTHSVSALDLGLDMETRER